MNFVRGVSLTAHVVYFDSSKAFDKVGHAVALSFMYIKPKITYFQDISLFFVEHP